MFALTAVAVFACGFFIDIMYVTWVNSVQQKRVWVSSFASVGLAIPSLVGYTAIIGSSSWLAVPYLLGLFGGNWVAVRRLKKDGD